MSFYHTYPLSLKDTLASPGIESFVFQQFGHELDWPSLSGVKRYARLFGHSDSAIRTGVSRANKNKELIVSVNGRGDKEVAISKEIQGVVAYFLKEPFSGSCFSLITCQFSSGDGPKRYLLKDLLTRLSYVKISQNTYLRYGSSPEAVDALLKERDLYQFVYHFHRVETLPERFENEIETHYKLGFWREQLQKYTQELTLFLSLEPLDSELGYLHYLFARSAFHKNIMMKAPFLPEKYFLEVSLLKQNYEKLSQIAHKYMEQHVALYTQIFN